MSQDATMTRRSLFVAGAALIGGLAGTSAQASVPEKKPGEIRVLYFGGDYVHNRVTQERYLRQTFAKSGFRMFFAQASRFITPELLATVDLFMLNRVGDFDAEGFSPEGLVENRPEPDPFLDSAMENAIIDNVHSRGMGFMALHCTAGNADNTDLMKLIGIRPYKSGEPLQAVRFHDFDPDHPITRGYEPFGIDEDEHLKKEIVDSSVTLLFNTTGADDGITAPGGWCVERGRGRVVVLLAGHTRDAWRNSKYRELHWRSAHWAMNRDIPAFVM